MNRFFDNFSRQRNKGFTLIELLVVIAIIGLLSVLAVVSFNNARSKARDAAREADLKALNNAIQLYIQANDQAPAGDAAGNDVCRDDESCWSTGDLATALSTYSSPIPIDPHPEAATGFYYVYVSPDALMATSSCPGTCPTCNRESYQLFAVQMENTANVVGFNDSECEAWLNP